MEVMIKNRTLINGPFHSLLITFSFLLLLPFNSYNQDSHNLIPAKTISDIQEDTLSKPTIIYYWATWCAPCLGKLNQLFNNCQMIGNDLNFVTMLYNDNRLERASAFIEKDTCFKHYLDVGFTRSRDIVVSSLPHMEIFDKKGNQIWSGGVGLLPDSVFLSQENLEEFLKQDYQPTTSLFNETIVGDLYINLISHNETDPDFTGEQLIIRYQDTGSTINLDRHSVVGFASKLLDISPFEIVLEVEDFNISGKIKYQGIQKEQLSKLILSNYKICIEKVEPEVQVLQVSSIDSSIWVDKNTIKSSSAYFGDDELIFENYRIEDFCKVMERWYRIPIHPHNRLKNLFLSGRFELGNNLEEFKEKNKAYFTLEEVTKKLNTYRFYYCDH